MANRSTHQHGVTHHAEGETPSPDHSGRAITILKVQPYEHADVPVTSTAVDADGWLDPVFSKAQDDMSPPLAWTSVLEAETYALVVEDPDAPMEKPFVHWLMWNIPGKLTELPQGVAKTAHPEGLDGAVQGFNSLNEHGWTGMAPPEGHGVHHYHFQLFALTKRLEFGPNTPLEELVNALRGNTMAQGELVGLYENADRPSPGRTGGYGAVGGEPAPQSAH